MASTRLGDGVTGDAELIAAVRTGDAEAFGALYERHAGAAFVVARQYTDSHADADDVVADAFTAVHGALQRGNGPESAFRAYLFTVVRRTAADRREKARRVQPTDDLATLERGTAWAGTAEEPALEGFERGVVSRAFHSLPERWQAVLWHSEVEGLSPAEIAPVLGLTANGVAALAYRAREGLRQAYLQQHLQDPLDEGCRTVSGKLGAYVRGGLGTRENAQVEKHLDGCGDCRALVLELGDVNHGMRAVVAPLVLGVVGLGALAHVLPVGGGIAAGAAALSGGAGAGAAGGAGGAAGGAGGVAAGAGAATGTTAVVGATAGTAATGGVAALLSSIPLGAVAVAAGSVAVAAIAAVGIYGLTRGTDPEALPAPSVSVPAETPTPTPGTDTTPAPTPTPTPSPTDVPDLDESGALLADEQQDGTPRVRTGPRTTTDEQTPDGETTPPPPAPADVDVVLPEGGLVLSAGIAGQELAFGVQNTGGTVATDLVAEVTLPVGVSVDGIADAALAGLAPGRFAVTTAAGWVCADGTGTGVVRCTLATLPPSSVARLVLSVSIDEAYDGVDAAVGLRVAGGGIQYRPAPFPLRIQAAPARLALRSTPASLALLSGRPTQVDLDLANVGGSPVGPTPATATLQLPAGVTWAPVDGSAWECADGAAGVTCRTDRIAPRTAAPLSLLLTADEPGAVGARTLGLDLRPTGVRAPEHLELGFTVQRPTRLGLTGDVGTTLARGRASSVALAVSNLGDVQAPGLVARLTRPAGAAWPATPVDGWTCDPTDTVEITCTHDVLPGGGTVPLTAHLDALPGAVGGLGDLVVRVDAPGADAAQEHRVAVSATAPVLTVTPPVVTLTDSSRTGTVSFAVSAAGGDTAADADDVVATLTLPAAFTVDTEGGGPTTDNCVALDARRFRCDVGAIAAGGASEVLVNVRWSGSARGAFVAAATGPGASPVSAATDVSTSSAGLSPRGRFEGGWSVTEVGAPLLTCRTTLTTCLPALQNGDRDNNSFDMVELDEAPDLPDANGTRPAVRTSSSTQLDVPAGRQIAFAGLYWSANIGPGDTWSGDPAVVRFRGPGTPYQTLRAADGDVDRVSDNAGRSYYQSFVDVTSLVAAEGGGTWSVADVAVRASSKDPNRSYYAGWSLVVVYADPSSDSTVTVYDGAAWIGTSAAPPVFEFAAEAGTSARLGVVAWEGDRTAVGDRLLLDGNRPLVPVRWDGSTPGSGAGNAFDSTAHGWRWPNSLGLDAKAFAPVRLSGDVSSLSATTSGDQYLIGVVTLRTEPVVASERAAG